jgi:hypothetical protein
MIPIPDSGSYNNGLSASIRGFGAAFRRFGTVFRSSGAASSEVWCGLVGVLVRLIGQFGVLVRLFAFIGLVWPLSLRGVRKRWQAHCRERPEGAAESHALEGDGRSYRQAHPLHDGPKV